MNQRFAESRESVIQAREALRRGDTTQARQWAEHAAELAPQSEDAWLILAALAGPRDSLDYIRKALQVNPNSPRARKGMEWAMDRLRATPVAKANAENNRSASNPPRSTNRKTKRGFLLPIMLALLGCIVVGFAAWSAVTSP